LISASTHRTQYTNLAECLDKLKAVILDAARRDPLRSGAFGGGAGRSREG
jgi:hypothetical protein